MNSFLLLLLIWTLVGHLIFIVFIYYYQETFKDTDFLINFFSQLPSDQQAITKTSFHSGSIFHLHVYALRYFCDNKYIYDVIEYRKRLTTILAWMVILSGPIVWVHSLVRYICMRIIYGKKWKEDDKVQM